MTDAFVQALHEWQNFYFMIGTASATLIGLMFVAVSLGADLPSARDLTGVNTFVTPILIHFISVLAVAGIMLVPTMRLVSLDVTLLVVGTLFTVYSCRIGWRFVRHPSSSDYTRTDWKWYVIYPVLGDGLIVVTALWLFMTNTTDALNLLAVASAILLVVSLRNTWDLMLWIAQNRDTKSP